MNFITTVRRITVILLLILGTLTLISGVVLLVVPKGPGSGDLVLLGLSKRTWEDIHIYASFVAVGSIVVHLTANLHALKYYLFGKRK